MQVTIFPLGCDTAPLASKVSVAECRSKAANGSAGVPCYAALVHSLKGLGAVDGD